VSDSTEIVRREEHGDPCVVWLGACNSEGYGHFFRDGQYPYVHRAVWEAVYGLIPDGLCVLHHCDNPPCYNLEHLFLGTKGDNIRDAITKGRWTPWQCDKTHCKRGHEYTRENTAVSTRGTRRCRACARETSARSRVLLPEPTTCPECGEVMPPRRPRANPRKYCSGRCATRAYRHRREATLV